MSLLTKNQFIEQINLYVDCFYRTYLNDLVQIKLDRAISVILYKLEEEPDNYNELINSFNSLLSKTIDLSDIYEDRVDSALNIIIKSFEFFNLKTNKLYFAFLD